MCDSATGDNVQHGVSMPSDTEHTSDSERSGADRESYIGLSSYDSTDSEAVSMPSDREHDGDSEHSGSGYESNTRTFSGDSNTDNEDDASNPEEWVESEDSDSESELERENVSETQTHPTVNLSLQEMQSLTILSYFLRHNVTGTACQDLVSLMKALFPKSSDVHNLTVSNIWNFVQDTTNYKEIHYCVVCGEAFGDDGFLCETIGCSGLRFQGSLSDQQRKKRKPRASFVVGDGLSQIKYILQRPGNWDHIQANRKALLAGNAFNVIADITDGEQYRKLLQSGQFLSNLNNVSAVFNTDVIPLYASSGVKLWPIFLALNELHPSVRFARQNIVLVGIWQGSKGNPPFKAYLQSFSQQMSKLYHDGLTIDVNGKSVVVKLGVFLASLDLQAKAYALNMTMFNGAEACSTCLEPGYTVKQGKGSARFYPYRPVADRPPLRNHESIIANGRKATPQRRVHGLKGSNGLTTLPGFNLVTGVVPDYMHGVLMGVTKSLMNCWFSSQHSKKPYYVGKDLKKISRRMLSIQPPYFVTRLPRDLESSYAHLKASELQSWLLYYGPPCLKGILQTEYLEHFCLLSGAIHILLEDNILPDDLDSAREMLDKFYEDYALLYGEGSCGLNVHNIGAHLVYFVEQWGPLWGWSCFGFEDRCQCFHLDCSPWVRRCEKAGCSLQGNASTAAHASG